LVSLGPARESIIIIGGQHTVKRESMAVVTIDVLVNEVLEVVFGILDVADLIFCVDVVAVIC
jgi:hypothetical protein